MRALRVLLATLMVVAGVTVGVAVTSAPALADEPQSSVEVELDSFAPSLPSRDSVITITGEVTNTSKKRIDRPRAYFWRNQAPITDDEGFDQALDSDSNDPVGRRYIPSFANLYSPDDPYLAPGDSADFSLKVRVSELELSPTSGIYLMGVHVLQDEQPTAIGRARVFVPVLSKQPRNSQQMTTVVMLNSRPSLVSRGTFSDDHLAEEIAPDGRLDKLIDAADDASASFAVDPALIEEIETMRNGYRVLADGGKDGTGRADAQRWLDEFDRVLATRDGYRLLYGSPDLAALAHTGRQDVLAASQAAARTVSRTSALPLLVWPGNGAADLETVAAGQSLKPAAIILSENSTRTSDPLLQGVPVSGQTPVKIVSYAPAATEGGPGPDPSDTAVHQQQRLLSQSWLQAATEPAGSTLGRVRVVSTASQADSDDESAKAPWIRQTSLSQLLRGTPTKWSQSLHYSSASRNKELTSAQLGALDQLAAGWNTWQDLLVDKSSARMSANAAVARTAGVRLRKTTTSFSSFVDPQLSDLDQRLDAVQISVTRHVLTPKSRIPFPVTIRNTLPPSDNPDDQTTNQVRVQLRFESANSQRLTVQPIGTSTIRAGQNLQGNAYVDARTNGTVEVTAQLYTASGLPVGRPRTIDVKATQAGTVGWFIAIGAGIVLVGTTALRIRQVTRARAKAAGGQHPAAGDTAPIDATRSAPPQDVPPATGTGTGTGTGSADTLTDAPGQNTSESIDV